MNGINKRKFVISYYFKLFSTDFGSIQIFCTIRLANHRKKPGTATQCKTKDSSCHRQSSVRALSGIRAAQPSVFCVVFCRPLFIHFVLFRLAIALPALLRIMTSDNPFGIYKLFLSFDLYTHNYTIPIIKFISL